MNKKTIIIFISVFVIVGVILFTVTSLINKKKNGTTDTSTPWYQNFNPFGTGVQNQDSINGENPTETGENGETNTNNSKFYRITDFAISGATFLMDTRPVISNENVQVPEPVKVVIDANTKEGRKEIQTILNKTLSLTPPLVVDGSFGKLATQAIKDFQKLNNLAVTGTINTETAPFFTKTSDVTVEKNPYEQAPSVRYVGRMNGHVYKKFLDTKKEDKLSNSTIPSVYESFFNGGGNTVIYRYLSSDNTVSSFMATLGESHGNFLPKDISDLSVSQDKTKFFYLTENSNGVNGIIKTFGDSTNMTIAFSSPFTEWLSQWANNKDIYLTTKASYGVDGSIFLLNSTNKTISKIFGGIKGLTTLVNHSSSLVLYSYTSNTGPKLGVFNIAKHTTKDLNLYGLPEKCVWSKDNVTIYCAIPSVITGNQYPDYWYQGLISFDDYFMKINTDTGVSTTIADSTKETPVDGTYLFLSSDEDALFFTNKKDSTFWSLKIN